MKHKNRKKFSSKKLFIAALVLLLVIAGGVWLRRRNNQSATDQSTATTENEDAINYGPPTEEEQKAGDEQKAKIEEEEKEQSAPPDSTASVIITDAGQYDNVIEVRAFISDHYEDGDCIIKFTKGSQTVTKTTDAYRDASTTICTNPLLPRSSFPSAGDWQVTVSYKASGASGSSKAQTITIR